MRPATYDPKVYRLASHFLFDEPKLNTEAARVTLASGIQQFIEAEIQFMRDMMENSNGPA